MVACPFNVPTLQWDKAIAYIEKCTFCADRMDEPPGQTVRVDGKPLVGDSVQRYRRGQRTPACAKVCPRRIISMVPFKADRISVVACANHDPGKLVRAVCTVGCIGCGICAKLNDLFNVSDNLAATDYDRFDASLDLGPAMEKCPRKTIVFIGKPSEKDLAAVADEPLAEPVEAAGGSTVDDAPRRG